MTSDSLTGAFPSTAKAEKIFLFFLGLAFLLFSWPVIKLIVQVYEHNPDYSHGYLISLLPPL